MMSDHTNKQDISKGLRKALGFVLKSRNTIVASVVSFFIGASLAQYNDFRSRPIITADVNSMTIRKSSLSNWEVAVAAKFNNTGRTQGFLTIQSFEFKFPMFSD